MTSDAAKTGMVRLAEDVAELALQGKIRGLVILAIGDSPPEVKGWKVQAVGDVTGLEIVGALAVAQVSLSGALVDPRNPTEGRDR